MQICLKVFDAFHIFVHIVTVVRKSVNIPASQNVISWSIFTRYIEYCSYSEIKCVLNKYVFNPLLDDKILDCSKLKQIADNILKCF